MKGSEVHSPGLSEISWIGRIEVLPEHTGCERVYGQAYVGKRSGGRTGARQQLPERGSEGQGQRGLTCGASAHARVRAG